MEKCEKCRFFKPIRDVGKCRRFPPVQDGHSTSTIDEFSTVPKDEWCGEFKKGVRK